MKRFVTKDGNMFLYEVLENNFAVITGYSPDGGIMTFSKGDDGRRRHFIQVPEQLDGYPVLTVDFFSVELKMRGEDRYRHDGSSLIEVRVPEHTEFEGFRLCFTDEGYFFPEYRVTYYQRENCSFLKEKHKGFVYFAKALGSDLCSVIRIITEDKTATELCMPSRLCGRKIVAIEAESTYMLPEPLRIVRIADSVVTIGAGCFSDMPCIEKLYLGKGVRRIGENAFCFYSEGNEDNLIRAKALNVYYYEMPFCAPKAFSRYSDLWFEEYDVKYGWVRIGETPIKYEVNFISVCKDNFCVEKDILTEYTGNSHYITVTDEVSEIGNFAFSENKCIKTVVLPFGIRKIGEFAFSGCSCLTDIVIPESVTEIGEGAFKNCSSLKSIRFPDGIKVIAKSTCEGCVGLTEIKLSEKLEEISERAFEGCSFANADIPQVTKCIKYRAFARCSNLKKPKLPKGIQVVDIFAFG